MDDQLKHFYSCLILMTALRPPRSRQNSSTHPKAGWRRFLNDLCWFCDTETGGKSVVAIAVQQRHSKLRLWLACNQDTAKPLRHLEWILKKLANAHILNQSQINGLETEVLSESVRISRKKVEFHARRLQLRLEDVAEVIGGDDDGLYSIKYRKSALLTPTVVDHLLEKSLRLLLEKNRYYYRKLSHDAYAFRKDPLYVILKQLASGNSALAARWSTIRHHVGRLGSWAKSTSSLLRMAQSVRFQQHLALIECRPVFPLKALSLHIVEQDEGYGEILQRVFPAFDPDKLHNRFEICTSDDESALKLINKIHRTDPQPIVHAEMIMLEHSLSNGFTFAVDQYIACSKPPCYCCQLYASSRSRNIEMRPGHGNAYPKWFPPCRPTQSGTQPLSAYHSILSQMTGQMQQIVQRQLFRGSDRGEERPDSATDISTTLPSMREPL